MKITKNTFNILVVDDEREYLDTMEIILENAGFKLDTALGGEEALTTLKEKTYDLVLTDLIMQGMDGFMLLENVKSLYPETEVIVITGYGTVKDAIQAMKNGAYTYFIKSHDPAELLLEIVKIFTLKSLKNENEILKESKHKNSIVTTTKSQKFKKVFELAKKAANSSANILILGESGVGKEVFAQYIHDCSERKNEQFIGINCHAFSENLLESELFGHEKGAYTGAYDKRKGRFEAASDGTILLDEIGDISLSTQVKLLRILETKKVERLGSNQSIDVNFRLLCATNKDIYKAMKEEEFREDLFFRISTIIIEIPPLRERKEDLQLLIDFFIKKSCDDSKKSIVKVEEGVMNFLYEYDYPGNVRELKNIIERLVVLSEDNVIRERDLQIRNVHQEEVTEIKIDALEDIRPLKDIRKETESKYIAKALAKCDNNVTKTAESLKISRRQLINKINEYNLK